VLLICWDGGQAGLVQHEMTDGNLPHFAALAQSGLQAEHAISVDPTLSASAQSSLVTGAYPQHTGIPSNAFHHPSDSFYWYRQGFEQPLDDAEPVWVSASRAGLTTAALFIAGATPSIPQQMADLTIGYGGRDAYSEQVKISLHSSEAWENSPPSYSPPLLGSFHIPQVTRVDLLVLDASNDQIENYDTVLLRPGAIAEPVLLEEGEWGELVLVPETTAGADFLIQAITPQEVTLYHSGVYHNLAAPRALLENLNTEFGFFPAGPDEYALEHGWINEDDYLYEMERASRWMAEVIAWVYQTYQPDLTVAWHDGFDSALHTFWLVDERQPGYSTEKASRYAGYRAQAVHMVDAALETILRPVNLQQTTVLLTADHGSEPIHTNVFVNTILEKARLLTLDRRNYVLVDRSQAIAFTSGSSVQIYINLRGREQDGIVPPEEYLTVQSQIIDQLKSLADPLTGQPVFQRVLARQELSQLHLDHPLAGDIFAQANPGYSLDDWRGNDQIFGPVTYLGGHGFDSAAPEMHAFFIAAGGGVQQSEDLLAPVRIIDIAPTIAALLSFQPGPNISGQPIAGLIEP
jgi:predicted AlkP superfamily phosphohydrolase/phosphomutase